jgi:gliding motility-associated protein GldL
MSNFRKKWNSPKVQAFVSTAYSVGAAVVIVGALFKILHWAGANYVLGIGMFTEAFIFLLSAFDTPPKHYEWESVFTFDGKHKFAGISQEAVSPDEIAGSISAGSSTPLHLNYGEHIEEEDVKKLSESIKNLNTTAKQLSSLSGAIGSTEEFAKNIVLATGVTGKFANVQNALNNATEKLFASYSAMDSDMDAAASNTKNFAGSIDQISKNLSSINALYEIQLKNIQAQSNSLTEQTQNLTGVGKELANVVVETEKMKTAALQAAEETEKYSASTARLTQQISELNKVYGNMLNALN